MRVAGKKKEKKSKVFSSFGSYHPSQEGFLLTGPNEHYLSLKSLSFLNLSNEIQGTTRNGVWAGFAFDNLGVLFHLPSAVLRSLFVAAKAVNVVCLSCKTKTRKL